MGIQRIEPIAIPGYNASKVNDAFSEPVLELAEEIVTRVIDELQAGPEWMHRWNSLSEEEKKALYKCIADGFNDETGE